MEVDIIRVISEIGPGTALCVLVWLVLKELRPYVRGNGSSGTQDEAYRALRDGIEADRIRYADLVRLCEELDSTISTVKDDLRASKASINARISAVARARNQANGAGVRGSETGSRASEDAPGHQMTLDEMIDHALAEQAAAAGEQQIPRRRRGIAGSGGKKTE